MTEDRNTQNEKNKESIAAIAKKKRQLYLYDKLHKGKPLSAAEIKEVEEFERSPLPPGCVRMQKDAAQALGVDKRTVERWASDGMPVTPEGNYDILDIKAWRMTRQRFSSVNETEKDKWDIEYRKNKALIAEIEYKRLIGEVLPKDEVEKGRIARIIAVKRSFLALPTRLAPTLAMKEPREINAILYEAICEIIDEFAGVRRPPEEIEEEAEKDTDGMNRLGYAGESKRGYL